MQGFKHFYCAKTILVAKKPEPGGLIAREAKCTR